MPRPADRVERRHADNQSLLMADVPFRHAPWRRGYCRVHDMTRIRVAQKECADSPGLRARLPKSRASSHRSGRSGRFPPRLRCTRACDAPASRSSTTGPGHHPRRRPAQAAKKHIVLIETSTNLFSGSGTREISLATAHHKSSSTKVVWGQSTVFLI